MQRGRQAVATLCAAWFAISVLGAPLPAGASAAKDGSTPYICQGHSCGCPSAEACWRHCCCFTTEEKLAWAMQQGIAPPPEAVADVLAARQAATQGRPQPRRSCCERKAANDSRDAVAAESNSSRSVSLIQHQRCRGAQPWWCLMGAAIEPPAKVAAPSDAMVSAFLVLPPPRWRSRSLLPEVPPPRWV